MQEAIDQFHANLTRIRNLDSIVAAMSSLTTPEVDLTDILRAELVMSVSALDYYVHEVVRFGMLESYSGTRTKTSQFRSFQISLGPALDALNLGESDDTWISEEIRSRHSFRTFQTPDNIASAIGLISGISLWLEVARHMNTDDREVKEELRNIVDRRNKIAHEADMSQSPYEDLIPIGRQMVTDAVNFLERVVEAIHAVIH